MRKLAALSMACLALGLQGCTGGRTIVASKGVVHNGLFVDQHDVPLCPVTGDPVAAGKEIGKTVYNGVEYHFCCPGCPEEFKANPVKYAARK